MKIAHIADIHLTQGPRFEEQLAYLSEVKRLLLEEVDPDLVLIAGDLTNHQPRKATPTERSELCRFLAGLPRTVVIRGNHDILGDWSFLSDWGALAETPILYAEGLQIVRAGDVSVFCCPWPDISHLLGSTPDEKNRSFYEQLDTFLEENFTIGGTNILLAHANLRGSVVGLGQPMIGHDFELSVEFLREYPWDYVALGHIHKCQSVGVAHYPGSLWPQDYGELERKGFKVFDTETRKVTFVELKTCPMVSVDAWWRNGEWEIDNLMELISPEVYQGAHTRVVAHYSRGESIDRAGLVRMLEERGAIEVKIQPAPENTVQVKIPELQSGRKLSTWEKLEAMWTSQGTKIDASDELQTLVAEMEESHGTQMESASDSAN